MVVITTGIFPAYCLFKNLGPKINKNEIPRWESRRRTPCLNFDEDVNGCLRITDVYVCTGWAEVGPKEHPGNAISDHYFSSGNFAFEFR